MILTKLQEALAEIPAQRKAIDEVEAALRSMIAKLQGTPPVFQPVASSVAPVVAGRRHERDQLDEIADLLRAAGKPLHISQIAEKLSAIRGTNVVRTMIEPGLNRHITKTKLPRISKVAPSTYGLPEWKNRQQPTLTQIAS
jgi:hypothetical protein